MPKRRAISPIPDESPRKRLPTRSSGPLKDAPLLQTPIRNFTHESPPPMLSNGSIVVGKYGRNRTFVSSVSESDSHKENDDRTNIDSDVEDDVVDTPTRPRTRGTSSPYKRTHAPPIERGMVSHKVSYVKPTTGRRVGPRPRILEHDQDDDDESAETEAGDEENKGSRLIQSKKTRAKSLKAPLDIPKVSARQTRSSVSSISCGARQDETNGNSHALIYIRQPRLQADRSKKSPPSSSTIVDPSGPRSSLSRTPPSPSTTSHPTPHKTKPPQIFDGVWITRRTNATGLTSSGSCMSHAVDRTDTPSYSPNSSPIHRPACAPPSPDIDDVATAAAPRTSYPVLSPPVHELPVIYGRSPSDVQHTSPSSVIIDPRNIPIPATSTLEPEKIFDGVNLAYTDVQGGRLPTNLIPCMHAQKRSILRAILDPKMTTQALPQDEGAQQGESEHDDRSQNSDAFKELHDLLIGTIDRGEGNSCLLLGPKGSGKSRIILDALGSQSTNPIIIRLNGYAQVNDRLAMKEIARQLAAQTESVVAPALDDRGEDEDGEGHEFFGEGAFSAPSPAHLPAFISTLPMQSRPVVLVVDAFDLFTTHSRQALLYCLLDTVQSCRSGSGSKGLAVVGVTTRVDTVNLLEKRVKSRFSSRIIHTSNVLMVKSWTDLIRRILHAPIAQDTHQRVKMTAGLLAVDDMGLSVDADSAVGQFDCISPAALQQWQVMWHNATSIFLQDPMVDGTLNDTFALSRDVQVLRRILTTMILRLSEEMPFPIALELVASAALQRSPSRFPFLHTLPRYQLALLISVFQSQTEGREIFTFEILYNVVNERVRATKAAPIHLGGFNPGMISCTRTSLAAAFEHLVATKIFVPTTATSLNVAPEYIKYRCAVEREEIRAAVYRNNNTELIKWFNEIHGMRILESICLRAILRSSRSSKDLRTGTRFVPNQAKSQEL